MAPPATLVNGFVSEFSSAGQLVYSTYFGASGYTRYQASSTCLVIIGPHGTTFGAAVFTKPTAIAVDTTGAVVIAGASNANNLPVTVNAYSQQCGCTNLLAAAFVAKISPGGGSVVWGTYIPLTQSISLPPSLIPPTTIRAIALDNAGNVVLTGSTPQYFPTTPGAVQVTFPVPSPDVYSQAGFATKLDALGASCSFPPTWGERLRSRTRGDLCRVRRRSASTTRDPSGFQEVPRSTSFLRLPARFWALTIWRNSHLRAISSCRQQRRPRARQEPASRLHQTELSPLWVPAVRCCFLRPPQRRRFLAWPRRLRRQFHRQWRRVSLFLFTGSTCRRLRPRHRSRMVRFRDRSAGFSCCSMALLRLCCT